MSTHPKGKVDELADLKASLPFYVYESEVAALSDDRVKYNLHAEKIRKRIAELENGSATPKEAEESGQEQAGSQVQELPGTGPISTGGPERTDDGNNDPNGTLT